MPNNTKIKKLRGGNRVKWTLPTFDIDIDIKWDKSDEIYIIDYENDMNDRWFGYGDVTIECKY